MGALPGFSILKMDYFICFTTPDLPSQLHQLTKLQAGIQSFSYHLQA